MNRDLLNKALALCSEIEERQAQLKDMLNSLAAADASEQAVEAVEVEEEHPSPATDPELPVDAETTPVVEPSPEPLINPLPEPSPSEVPEILQPIETPAPVHSDLRKAFTINDRFRFRRELFGGDDKAMLDVIARLSEAKTYADAQDYIAGLGWSADNEAAGEFKEIVSTYFNGYRI